MPAIENALHLLLDVAAGRRNLGAHEVDAEHDKITPGYSDKPVPAEELAAAQAVLDRQARLAAAAAAAAAPVPAVQERPGYASPYA